MLSRLRRLTSQCCIQPNPHSARFVFGHVRLFALVCLLGLVLVQMPCVWRYIICMIIVFHFHIHGCLGHTKSALPSDWGLAHLLRFPLVAFSRSIAMSLCFLAAEGGPGKEVLKGRQSWWRICFPCCIRSGLTLIVSLFECHDFEVAPVGPTGWRWPWSSVAAWFLLAAALDRWATVATIRNFILGSYRPELAGQFQMLCEKACQDLFFAAPCMFASYQYTRVEQKVHERGFLCVSLWVCN